MRMQMRFRLLDAHECIIALILQASPVKFRKFEREKREVRRSDARVRDGAFSIVR